MIRLTFLDCVRRAQWLKAHATDMADSLPDGWREALTHIDVVVTRHNGLVDFCGIGDCLRPFPWSSTPTPPRLRVKT